MLALALTLLACRSEPANGGPTADDTGEPSPETPAEEACQALAAGPPGDEDPRLELARAHATARFFRPSRQWWEADQALVDALAGESWDAEAALPTWAAGIEGACATAARDAALGPATVTLVGEVAVVVPGTGAVEIPSPATAVALDLRELPAGPDALAAVEEALAAVLVGPVALADAEVRAFAGLPGVGGGVYFSEKDTVPWEIDGRAGQALPLAVLTGVRQAPEAARAAGALRIAGLAWLVGQPAWSQVAESSWSPVGAAGVSIPTRRMQAAGQDWPDVIDADVVTSDPQGAVADLATWGAPPALAGGEATRPDIRLWEGDTTEPLSSLDRGAARALLMVAHGNLDRFYPYWEVVGRAHDAALLASLDEVDAAAEGDREAARRALGRLLHSAQDGHGFFFDWTDAEVPDAHLPLQIERVDGAPVIRASAAAGVEAGDTITAIEGTPAGDWYDASMAWHSAATPGYLFEVAGREWWLRVDGPVEVEVLGADGAARTVQVEGIPAEDHASAVPWGGTFRPSGWLSDLGAPTAYFLNLNGVVTPDDDTWQAALAEAQTATALVVDMRDYPIFNHYNLAQALSTEAFTSPTFRYPTWMGPDEASWWETRYDFDPEGTWTGPITLLVSNKTVSAAENLCMMLWGRAEVTVVGQQSAGTNGNITVSYLPGGFVMYMTGMEVLNPDGSGLHGVGIPLDLEVHPTPADFAAGVDPELAAAVALLGG